MLSSEEVNVVLSSVPNPSERALEIGCGANPLDWPNWFHMDLRPLAHIDFVQDCSDLTNIPDGSFSLIETVNTLEHVSWRKIYQTLAEWYRVLTPSGRVFIKVPNVRYIKDLIDVPDAQFDKFNTILGDQDYPENFHYVFLREDWVATMMENIGFSGVCFTWHAGELFETKWGVCGKTAYQICGVK